MKLLLFAAMLVAAAPAAAQTPTIVAREVTGWFYAGGKMNAMRPTFECVFEIKGNSLVRRSVRNIQTSKTEVDDTEYEIVTTLSSYNEVALHFKKLSASEREQGPVIRAIGMPGSDAIEILFVGPDWLQSVKTVRDYMVIQRFERTQ